MAEAFERSSTSLTTTGITDIYTAPSSNAADRAVILSCIAANIGDISAVGVTIDVTTAGDSKLSSIGQAITVPANSSVEFIANKLILKQGEKLRATASTASRIDCTVSALEITV